MGQAVGPSLEPKWQTAISTHFFHTTRSADAVRVLLLVFRDTVQDTNAVVSGNANCLRADLARDPRLLVFNGDNTIPDGCAYF